MVKSLPQHAHAVRLLPTTVEYAFRALAELAGAAPAETVPSADLAVRTGVPEAYLQKVLRRLVSHGLLHGSKGHGGGFSLARPASRIRFADVLDAMDALPSIDRCAFGRPRCSSANPCPLHPAWARLRECVTEWADTTTVADVASGEATRRVRRT
jgi:Rrf2 family iron-sulfur cluster assembly transcriptional regulator